MIVKTLGRDGLTDMQRDMLDSVADGPERDAIYERLIASNAPHPFRQVALLTLEQRLCGLPAAARDRALAGITAGRDVSRYTGIAASSVYTTYHNFGSGGYFCTAYAGQFGDGKAQLGNILNTHGSIDQPGGFAAGGGRWVRVQPNSVHSGEPWGYVWVDPLYTHVSGAGMGRRGLALDAATVPVVFTVQVTVAGQVIGRGAATSLPHRMHEAAEQVRAQFAAEGVPAAIVTYWPA